MSSFWTFATRFISFPNMLERVYKSKLLFTSYTKSLREKNDDGSFFLWQTYQIETIVFVKRPENFKKMKTTFSFARVYDKIIVCI